MAVATNKAASAAAEHHAGSTTASQLPLFEMSSQFRTWRYSAAGLAEARAQLNAGAVQRVRAMLKEEQETTSSGNSGHSNREMTATATASNASDHPPQPAPDAVQYLTVEDEMSLVAYYLAQLVRLCKMFKFPLAVESTAMTYLKRFYLRNTCMDYHPKNVMLTCLFLATKTENFVISIDAFTDKIPNCTPADVLSLEFLVAQSLKFQLKVHHADLAGRGMMLDMQTLLDNDDDRAHFLSTTLPKATSNILLLRLTDAEFLYTPSQIALAAFHMADPPLAERWLGSKLALVKDSKLKKGSGDDNAKQEDAAVSISADNLLRDVVDPLVGLAEKGRRAVDIQAVREVDRRLKYCHNPEKDPNSSLYKKREREREEEESRKRQRKLDDAKARAGPEDPFE